MKRKYMPIILMLLAGAVTSIITYIKDYSILAKLVSLLIVLVVFYTLGSLVKFALDHFDRQNEAAALEKGEVIEKEPETEEAEEKDT